MSNHKFTNELIHETSPYLLQHAHNPVNWMPWGEKALSLAKDENKLLLISIGYAACHWCHVMEHESFEDEEVAAIMNNHFICIKVDREERPDVDQIYMSAVQLMTHRGGWPLNAIALSDGRPIWGGTYFPKESWINTLRQIHSYHQQNPEKTDEYAEKLSNGIRETTLVPISSPAERMSLDQLEKAVSSWQSSFDFAEGGRKSAPKFMMPNNLQFLLRWAHQQQDNSTEKFVKTSLTKMALGGIYDQIGGGFARYSTDVSWKVPHFEKMLYDNGQLLSLYAQAWQKFKDPLYRETVENTIDFLEREMLSPEFGFYSSLDADSEGEEGKFYVWKKTELEQLIKTDFELFADYYNVNSKGHWEDGNYILLRKRTDEDFATKHQLSLSELKTKIAIWKSTLLTEREKRIRPGLDDKILTSWNALVITGLTDVYKALGETKYLDLAENNARFLKNRIMGNDGLLHHSYKNGISKIDGFLEDYALLAQAFISLYEITGNEVYLNDADILMQKSFELFFDTERSIFYFSAKDQKGLISRSIEIHDNVIPASNSVMANNLFRLGHLLGKTDYLSTAHNMLLKIINDLQTYPSSYSNWALLMLSLVDDHYEVAITGNEADKKIRDLYSEYIPNCLFSFGLNESKLPLLQNRFQDGKTLIYVCQNNTCKLPVEETGEALNLIHNK